MSHKDVQKDGGIRLRRIAKSLTGGRQKQRTELVPQTLENHIGLAFDPLGAQVAEIDEIAELLQIFGDRDIEALFVPTKPLELEVDFVNGLDVGLGRKKKSSKASCAVSHIPLLLIRKPVVRRAGNAAKGNGRAPIRSELLHDAKTIDNQRLHAFAQFLIGPV